MSSSTVDRSPPGPSTVCGVVGEGHGAHAHLVGHAVEEVQRRLLGRLEPGRLHVVGLHRARHVGHQHHRGALERHRHGPLRPRERDGQRGQRQGEQAGRQVAPPGGHGVDERGQGAGAREPDRVAAADGHGRRSTPGAPAAPPPAQPGTVAPGSSPALPPAERAEAAPQFVAARGRRWTAQRDRLRPGAARHARRRALRARAPRSARAVARSRVSTSTRAPVSGSTSARRPSRAARPRAGRGSRWRPPSGGTPAPRSGLARPSCPRKSDTTATRPGKRAARASRARLRGRPAGSPWPSGATPRSTARSTAAAAPRPPRGGSGHLALAAGHDQGHPPTAPGRQPGQHAHRALGHVGLQPLGGAERHRGGHVQHEPGGHRALGHVEPHVRLARAGGGGCVQAADVVTGLVGAQRRRARCPAPPRRPVLPRERAAGAPGERQVQRLDEAPGDRPRAPGGPRPAQRRQAPGCRHAATPPSSQRGSASVVMAARLDRVHHLLQHLVRRHAVAERLVAQHQPVAQHVGREVADVREHHVRPAAQQRQRAGGLDQPDRPTRAGAVLHVAGQVVQAPARPGLRVASASATA